MTTSIEWTDETWNPVVGCTKVSQGCRYCYAKTLHDKRHKALLAGAALPEQYRAPFETIQLMPERLDKPLSWRKPRRVFVNSVSDLFHEDVPFEFIDQVFAVMALTPQHTYQVLTKRPERMREYMMTIPWDGSSHERDPSDVRRRVSDASFSDSIPVWPDNWEDGALGHDEWPPPNVWLGVSVENQREADARIPELLATPAAVRFISAEPLLERVHLMHHWLPNPNLGGAVLNWVIAGGESGPGARPCDLSWIRGIVSQCQTAGVPVFVKQLGSKPIVADERRSFGQVFEHQPLRLKQSHGADMAEWPSDLRIREFPR